MSATLFWSLAALAVVIVAGLGAYAATLWREVRRREVFRQEETRRAHQNCLDSLGAIASAMRAEQVDLVEGALRCKVLLEIIDPALVERDTFRVFVTVYDETQHLRTHSSRNELTPRQRMDEDRQRLAVEDAHRPALLDAARAVERFKQGWPETLH
ncbi:Protein of unknown function [Franzmannia pantelleriensis]|uniref:DUF2489 domain-containing protein n=1 Tax=Franzmannia pantelleriensis TaxID=48727 RepID=A0A1G9FBD0_9GAMM|nr:DUF2489 domain-containing protein [Halomonas pantelleriensis]SDK85714.1 Protein of unknown function [Halomonas pantelleriensis]